MKAGKVLLISGSLAAIALMVGGAFTSKKQVKSQKPAKKEIDEAERIRLTKEIQEKKQIEAKKAKRNTLLKNAANLVKEGVKLYQAKTQKVE